MRSRSPSPPAAAARHPRPSWGPRSAAATPDDYSVASTSATSSSSSQARILPFSSAPPPPPLPRWDRPGPASSSANATVSTAPNRWTAAAKAGAAAAAAGSGQSGARAASGEGPGSSLSAYLADRSGSEPRHSAPPSYSNSTPDGPPPARGGPMMPPSSAFGRRRSPSPQRPYRSPSPSTSARPSAGGYGAGSFRSVPPPTVNGSGGPYPPPTRIPSASSSSSSAPPTAYGSANGGGGSSLPPSFLPLRPNFSPPRKRPYGGHGYEPDERDDFGPRGPPSPPPAASFHDYPYREDGGGSRGSWERDWSAPSSSSAPLLGGGPRRPQHPMAAADDWDRRRESDAREKDRLERDLRERDGPPSLSVDGARSPYDGRRNGGGFPLPPAPPLMNGRPHPHSLSPPLPPRRSMWPERFAPGQLNGSSSGPPDRPLPPHLASTGALPRRRVSDSPPPLPSCRREPYDRPLVSTPAPPPPAGPQPLGAPRLTTRFSSPYPTATTASGVTSPAVNGRVSYPPLPHLLPRFGPSAAAAASTNGGRSTYPAQPTSTFSPYAHASNGTGAGGGGPDHNAGRGESISLDYRESRSPERTPAPPDAAAGRRRPSNASSSTTTGRGGGLGKRTASPPPSMAKRQPGASQWDRPGGQQQQQQQHRRSSSIASVNGLDESSTLPVKQETLDREGLPPLPPASPASASTPAVGGWADVLTGPDGRRRPLPPPVVVAHPHPSSAAGRTSFAGGSSFGRPQEPERPPSPRFAPGLLVQPSAAAEEQGVVRNGIAVDDEKEEGEEDESPPPARPPAPQTKSLLERLSSPPRLLTSAGRVDGQAALAHPTPFSPPRSASPPAPAPLTNLPARQTASPPPPPPPAAVTTAAAVEPPPSPDHHSPRTPPETAGEETAHVVGPVSPESVPATGGGEQQADEKVQVVLGSTAEALVVLRTDVLPLAVTAPDSPVKPESASAVAASPSEQPPPTTASLLVSGLTPSENDVRRSASRSPSRTLQTLLNPRPEPMISPPTSKVAEAVVATAAIEPEPMDVDMTVVEVKAEHAAVPFMASSEAMEIDEHAAETVPTPTAAAPGDDADDDADADMSSVSRSSLTQDEMLDLVKAHVVSHARAAAGVLLSDGEIGQIIGFNACLADPVSSRLPRSAKVKEAAAATSSAKPLKVVEGLSLERQAGLRAAVAQRVELALASETEHLTELRSEYRTLNAEWTASCARLDRVTEKRKAAKRPAANPHARTPSVYTPGGASATPLQGTGLGGFDDFRPGRTSRSTRGNYPEQGYFQDVVRSEAEFQSILASLGDADYLDPNLRAARTAAVVPDMVRDPMIRERDAYDDANGLVLDPDAFYEITTSTDVWTDEEREIFAKKFASHPKQFGKIAGALPHKTADQCVLYYYRNKKAINFRAIAAARGDGRRRKGRRAGKASRLMANLEGKQKKASGGADQPLSARDGDETAPPSPLASSALAAMPTPSTATPSSSTSRKRKPTAASAAAAAAAADKSSFAPPSSTKSALTSPVDAATGTPTALPRARNGKSLLGSLMNPSPAVVAVATAGPSQSPATSSKAAGPAAAVPTPVTS